MLVSDWHMFNGLTQDGENENEDVWRDSTRLMVV
jgi:hypothetical protein